MSTKRKLSLKVRATKRIHTSPIANIQASRPQNDETENMDMGIIEKVSLRNFMCHTQLTMTFSSNVNFIVGKNGSGKSAIITAVVVGLGGKASSTSRGTSLKTLIKEGSNSATVEITLRNKGNEAYKRHLFGDHISIERRILADGATHYRLKSSEGKLITNKKEDLVQILDQFNVQVDNPLTCLNQEMSKHFLHSKSEHDKYKFFMKSTQLEQMSLDYAFVQEHRLTMHETLKRKEKMLPELEKEVISKEQKFRDLATLQELKKKINNLKGELAWAHVIHIEHSMKPTKRTFEQEQKRTPKYEQMLEKAKNREEEAQQRFDESQRVVREYMEKAKELDPKRQSAKQECDRNRQVHRQLENRLNTLLRQKNETFSDTKKIKARINDLMNSANTNIEAERQNRDRQLKQLNSDRDGLNNQQKNISQQISQFEESLQHTKDVAQKSRRALQLLNADKSKIEAILKSLMSNRNNRLQLFGVKMPQFVQKIEEEWRNKKFRQKPRGPIGACITLKDPNMAVPVESAIRSHISAFVVDNHNDMKVLSRLRSMVFSSKEASQITIYTSKFSNTVHNVANGKAVHNKYKCVLDLLNIEDPVVANCLIDMGNIETILVIPNMQDAMFVMQHSAKPPPRCSQAYTSDGDEVFEDRFYSNPREPVSRFLRADVADEIKRNQIELESINNRKLDIDKSMQENVIETRRNQTELRKLERTKLQIMNKLKEVQLGIRSLGTIEETSLPDVKDLLEEVTNNDQQLESYTEIIKVEGAKQKDAKQKLDLSESTWKKYEGEMRKMREHLDEFKDNIGKVENDLEKAKADRKYYEESKRNHLRNVEELQAKIVQQSAVVEQEQKNAMSICTDRINTRRTPSNIENEIRQIERRVQQEEYQHGQREQIIREYYEVKEQYKAIKSRMKWVRTFIREIESYLKQRQASFIQMRILISMRCRMTFEALLSQRGFTGKMHFNHNDRLLQISVQPGEDGITTNDMRALSGGERSFSTVCFILSLWEEIESPFRCLDEFDVFMDMANRRVAMEMMLEIAMHDQYKQFIFLTPHDISSLPQSQQIRVWKMADPERGQTTLPFRTVREEQEVNEED